MSPLHWAVEKSHDNIAELLLDHGASPHTVSKFMKTPYSIAKEKHNDFIVSMIEMLPTSERKPDIAQNHTQELNLLKSAHTVPDSPLPANIKRERIHSYDAIDVRRAKQSLNDPKNLTLQLLKEQMSMMTSSAEDSLIQSALQSGRRITLSEAGKRLLNDSNLNKFLKIPLNTTYGEEVHVASLRNDHVTSHE
jgi:GA-binding protein transcription factor, beta